MDIEALGNTNNIRDRRLAVFVLEERGLKPREIYNSLKNMADSKGHGVYPKLIPRTIYNDLVWGREHLDRETREELWDNDFIKTLYARLGETRHPSHIVGIMKLILSARMDMRRRHGLYDDKVSVEHSGEVTVKQVDEIIDFVNEFVEPKDRARMAAALRGKTE